MGLKKLKFDAVQFFIAFSNNFDYTAYPQIVHGDLKNLNKEGQCASIRAGVGKPGSKCGRV